DGHHGDTPGKVILSESGQFRAHVFHVGAMVADEHHEQGFGGRKIIAPHDPAGRVGQREIRGGGAQFKHVGRGQGHDGSMAMAAGLCRGFRPHRTGRRLKYEAIAADIKIDSSPRGVTTTTTLSPNVTYYYASNQSGRTPDHP